MKNLRSKVGPQTATALALPEHRDQQDQWDGGDTKGQLCRGSAFADLASALGLALLREAALAFAAERQVTRKHTCYLHLPAAWASQLSSEHHLVQASLAPGAGERKVATSLCGPLTHGRFSWWGTSCFRLCWCRKEPLDVN